MQHRHRRPRFSFTTWVLFTVIRVLCFTLTSTDYWMLGRTNQNMWGCHKELFCAILKHLNDLIINIITDQLLSISCEALMSRFTAESKDKRSQSHFMVFLVELTWFKDLKAAHEHSLSAESCRSVTLFVKRVKLSRKKCSDISYPAGLFELAPDSNVQNLI